MKSVVNRIFVVIALAVAALAQAQEQPTPQQQADYLRAVLVTMQRQAGEAAVQRAELQAQLDALGKVVEALRRENEALKPKADAKK